MSARNPAPVETRPPSPEDEEPIGELVEHVIGGARDLATHEAALVLVELQDDAQAIRRAAVLAMIAAACLSSALAWGGVALALALSIGWLGLSVLAIVFAALGTGLLLYARARLPPAILGKSRARLEQRVARVAESLR